MCIKDPPIWDILVYLGLLFCDSLMEMFIFQRAYVAIECDTRKEGELLPDRNDAASILVEMCLVQWTNVSTWINTSKF